MKQKHIVLFVLIWTLLVCVGLYKLFAWGSRPGEVAQFQNRWPAVSKLEVRSNLPSLVLFLHSACSCSYATLEELERLLPMLRDRAQVQVVFMSPDELDKFNWSDSKIWKRAQKIPSIQIIQDREGFEAKVFGAKTSGQTFLYDLNGELAFEGGLTPSRGHTGESSGQVAIRLFFEKRGFASVAHASVFGCGLAKRGSNVVVAK